MLMQFILLVTDTNQPAGIAVVSIVLSIVSHLWRWQTFVWLSFMIHEHDN